MTASNHILSKTPIQTRPLGLASLMLTGVMAGSSIADTHVVDLSGSGDYRYIQDAIDASAPGDVILVRPGTHRPKRWHSAVAVVPSHLTDLTIKSTGGPRFTTLQPSHLGMVLRYRRILASGSQGVRWHGGNGLLSGFTIRGGRASNGGGLYSNSPDLEVRSCDFIGNQADEKGGGAYFAPLETNSTLRPRLIDCDFESNSADGHGGSIYARGGIDLRECDFSLSEAGSRGGAIYIEDALSGSTFQDVTGFSCEGRLGGFLALNRANLSWNGGSVDSSEARYGGAVHADGGSRVELTDWRSIGNTATLFGGAVSLEYATALLTRAELFWNTADAGGALDAWYSSIVSKDSTWLENEAGDEGGAIASYEAVVELDGDTMHRNQAENGGAVWSDRARIVIGTATLSGNDADYGGAIFAEDSSVAVADGLFSANAADEQGGVLCLFDSDVDITSSAFANNRSLTGGAIYAEQGGSGSTQVEDCTFENNVAVEGGAVYAENFMDFTNVIFEKNESYTGGHLYLMGSGSGSMFTGCSFNHGALIDPGGWGGALYATISSGDLVLHGCDATGNHSGRQGGAFRFETASTGVTISSCRLESNEREHVGTFFAGDGGQVHASGAAVEILDSYISGIGGYGGGVYGRFNILRSTIDGAAGGTAGAAWLLSSSTVKSSVLIGSTDGALSAVYDDSGSLEDCVVMANRAENTPGSPGYSMTTTGAEVFNAIDCFFFANALDDIASISGIDSGNQLSHDAGCRADFDRDGDVDEDDADHVLALVGTSGWGLAEDLDDDGDIDADDHLEVVALEGTSCP